MESLAPTRTPLQLLIFSVARWHWECYLHRVGRGNTARERGGILGKKYCIREIGVRRKVEADSEGNNIAVLPTASATARVFRRKSAGGGSCAQDGHSTPSVVHHTSK